MKEGVTYKRLGEVANIYQPKTLATSELNKDGKYLVYGANGVIGRYDEYNHTEKELLVTCRGATCGTINVSEPYSWINGNAMVVHITDNTVMFDYLKYVLRALDWSNIITGAAQPQITRQNLAPTTIPVPSLEEQERIVLELDRIAAVIADKREQLRELDNLAQAIFYDMFGDPLTNPKDWDVKKLGEVLKLKSGDGLVAKNFVDGVYPVYGGNGIAGYHNQFNKEGVYVLIGRVGVNCGNVRTVSGKFWLTDNAFETIFSEKQFCNIFLTYVLNTLDLHKYANQAAQPVISNVGLKDIHLPIPPLALQEQFAEKVKVIEAQKDLLQQSVAEFERLLAQRMEWHFA